MAISGLLVFAGLPAPALAGSARPDLSLVREFGAVGDGVRLDTDAIQRAIDTCAARGGGTVVVTPGTYRVGTLVLRSNITLSLEGGATLLGSDRLEDYRPHRLHGTPASGGARGAGGQDLEALHLLYAEAAERITLTGQGVIDGNGRSFWDEAYQAKDRPYQLLQFEGCRDIRVDGITITNFPFWALHFMHSSRIRIDGITILNDRQGPNTDGVDITASSEVFITNCYINTGDDAICLKAPRAGGPTENVTVSHCTLVSDDSALKLGTSSHGVIRNIMVSQCIIRDSNYGIALFMKDGGMYADLLFTDIMIETTDPRLRGRGVYPLFVDLEKRDSTSRAGAVRNITMQRIFITSDGHSYFGGMPGHPLEGITLQDVHIRVPNPALLSATPKPRGVRGLGAPENDHSRVPSTISFAHARGVTLRNVRVEMEKVTAGAERHTAWALEVTDLTINGLSVAGGGPMLEMISLHQCSQVSIEGVKVPPAAPFFLAVTGNATHGIAVRGNDFSGASDLYRRGAEVRKDAIIEWNNLPPVQRPAQHEE